MQTIENIVIEECYKCGVLFGISNKLHSNLKENKNSFYCPNGHSQAYTKSTTEILRKKLETRENTINIKEDEIFELEKEIKKLKKPKKKKAKKKIIK